MATNRTVELTLPREAKNRVAPGDFFRVERAGTTLVLRQIALPDHTQTWFWSNEWLQKEKKAEEDIKKHRVEGPFRTVRDFMRGLK